LLRGSVAGIMLAMILLGTLSSVFALKPYLARAQETRGPRHDKGLEIDFYENSSLAFEALRIGEIDLLQWSLTYEQYQEAVIDPTLLVADSHGGMMMQFDLNNNYSIADFPGVRNPLNEVTFRRALACMVDKDWIIKEVLQGFWGERIDAPIGAAIMGYANQSVIGENYPYPYDLTRAGELLDVYFADTEDDGIRNYPVAWPGREDGPNLDPVKVCARSDHGPRLAYGRALADNMRALGIPVNQIEANSYVLFPIVWGDRNFHIYTGGWSSPPTVPMYLHALFHSSNWFPDGSNCNTGMNSSNLPNYPDLDVVLEDVRYPTDIEEFKAAVKKATGLLVADYCVNIPLWGSKYWMAYRMNIVGIVNSELYSLENTYTFLNTYKVDDPATPEDESQDPIKMGTVHAPNKLNILFSSWYYDYAVLDRIFARMIEFEPYNLAEYNPWICQDWESSTWYDPHDNKTKTVVTYWIREDVFWHAPVTGEAVRQLTAHDVEFTIWYGYSWLDDASRWVWGYLDNVHHTNIVDDFTIEIYFDYQSIWASRMAEKIPLLPKDEYLDLLCGASSASFYSDGTNCTASAKFTFTDEQVVQVIGADVDGASLVEGVDFEIFAKGDTHNEIHFLADLPEGTVTVNYYTPTVDPHGYYLGGLDWTQTFYSLGPYYLIEIQKGVGGWAIFECTPSHFLGASPLGEIDWKWTWQGTVKPRSGYFQVNLYDAVRLLKAYGSHGNGEPTANWFPGADIDPIDLCHVGLYDAVTILGKYGTKWGAPPP